ncbi:MAG: tRNA (adenosine(37)-N6)-dimethylallyltransferase MiaA [Treponema sp. CETP13]|nr:MAG: tRNA (adenosine(37)-N6)-dimethylallyltransferase MiaA [Treponema sp. CETP13]
MNVLSEETGTTIPEKGEDVPVLVIFAPTACGKTALMETLFAKTAPFGNRAEIINADSMQVYKGMDIGTAKPDKEFLSRVPHKMIDMCLPNEQFGAGEFYRNANKMCKDICDKKKLPVICGGTAFYIRNFLYGLPPTPQVNKTLRAQIAHRMEIEGKEVIWNELKELDPESAKKININDEYRIKRALEIVLETGHPRSYFSIPKTYRKGFNFCVIELERPREELYNRINKRVELLFNNGLENEVSQLIKSGYTKDDPGMQAIGYREFFTNKDEPLESIKSCIKKDTRRYAKRQITFFKQLHNVIRIPADDINQVQETICKHFPFLKDSTLDQM